MYILVYAPLQFRDEILFPHRHHGDAFPIAIDHQQVRKQAVPARPQTANPLDPAQAGQGNVKPARETPVADDEPAVGRHGIGRVDDALDSDHQQQECQGRAEAHAVQEGETDSHDEHREKEIHQKMYACVKDFIHRKHCLGRKLQNL